MPALKPLRNRITTIKSIKKITKAMQIISSIKLKKIKAQAISLEEYTSSLTNIVYNLAKTQDEDIKELNDNIYRNFFASPDYNYDFDHDYKDHDYKDDRMSNSSLWIVITSERGLCGNFNSSLLNEVKVRLKNHQEKGQEVKLIIIGRKGHEGLKADYADLIKDYYNITSNNLEIITRMIRIQVTKMVENQEIGSCYLIYNKAKNTLTRFINNEQILPIRPDLSKSDNNIRDYLYEGANLVEEIVNLYLKSKIYYALIASKISEEAARMMAMDNATRNGTELITKLTVQLNKSRQAIITTGLTEIIAGAEAL